jgi:SARP family transcriptional regulator, regulator of embCAB operon
MRAEVKVLGAFEVDINGVSVVPTASKPRQLLAMLAINAGRVVTCTALTEEIWGSKSPRSSSSTLQTYILTIRQLIRHALPAGRADLAKDIVSTRHTGYVLDIDADAVDAVQYDRLARDGRAAYAEKRYADATRLLSDALAVWHGPPLVDVTAGPLLEIETMRLAESRLQDLSLRIDADLHLGRHHQLLGDLAALCARHPLLENLRGQYMLALYRAGRPGQALETYQGIRATMREQLGVDPSPRLRQLHQAMLIGDPRVDDPTATAAPL